MARLRPILSSSSVRNARLTNGGGCLHQNIVSSIHASHNAHPSSCSRATRPRSLSPKRTN